MQGAFSQASGPADLGPPPEKLRPEPQREDVTYGGSEQAYKDDYVDWQLEESARKQLMKVRRAALARQRQRPSGGARKREREGSRSEQGGEQTEHATRKHSATADRGVAPQGATDL